MTPLHSFEVGEGRYFEAEVENLVQEMHRYNPPVSRRSKEMKKWVFETTLMTAVSAKNVRDIRYLLFVQRKK